MINLEQIRYNLNENIYKKLSANDNLIFNQLKPQALEIIEQNCGLQSDLDQLPSGHEWVLAPFAWIIEYIGIHLFATSPELMVNINKKYDNAIKLLKERNFAPIRDEKKAIFGQIEDSW